MDVLFTLQKDPPRPVHVRIVFNQNPSESFNPTDSTDRLAHLFLRIQKIRCELWEAADSSTASQAYDVDTKKTRANLRKPHSLKWQSPDPEVAKRRKHTAPHLDTGLGLCSTLMNASEVNTFDSVPPRESLSVPLRGLCG